jgi:DNA-binding NtrC family response regulator
LFREDLYFRLNVIRLSIPPLRERVGDIPLLIDHYLESYSQIHHVPMLQLSPAAMDVLIGYRWPGNIRELKNVVERIVLKAQGPIVEPGDLPSDVIHLAASAALASAAAEPARPTSVAIAEELLGRMTKGGESFWSVVYPTFMARDLTRNDLRKLVQLGLENTNGNYRLLVQLFNMPNEDYKRFLSFLRKHDCHLPFQRFRTVPARVRTTHPPEALAAGQR